MKAFETCKSKVIPLAIRDIDTDMIIPAQFLTSVSKEGYGSKLFSRLKSENPDFPLNDAKYNGAKILLADDNFGCGSSREHAVWALTDWGIQVVVCKSFADIFASNSGKNGLLLVQLEASVVDALLLEAQSGGLVLEVSLKDQVVSKSDGTQYHFEYDQFRKHCLLNGLDDVDYILSHSKEVEDYNKQREKSFFFSTLKVNNA